MHHPALLPAVTLLVGVTVGWRWPFFSSGLAVVFAGVVWAGSVALLLLDKRRPVTAAVSVGFVAVGLLLGTQATSSATTTSLRQWHERQRMDGRERGPVDIEGRLRRDAFATESGVSLDLGVERLRTPSGWVDMEGGIRVTVSGTLAVDRIEGWREGRMVIMPVTLRPAAQVSQSRCTRPGACPHVAWDQFAGIGQERPAGRRG